MGRYITGTEGIQYKYVYAEQDSNLAELAAVSQVGLGGMGGALRVQFFSPFTIPDSTAIDAVGPFTGVWSADHITAAGVLSTLDAPIPSSLESTIYELADRWKPMLALIDQRLGVVPFHVDLEGKGTFVLKRKEWPALLQWINKFLPTKAQLTLEDAVANAKQAQKQLATKDSANFLPLMALAILSHAIKHKLASMEVIDCDPIETNFWNCVADVSQEPTAFASIEERVLWARLLGHLFEKEKSVSLLKMILEEVPTHHTAAQALVNHALWSNDWTAVATIAERVLAANPSEPTRTMALCWRCEARWETKDTEGCIADAKAVARAERPELLAMVEEALRKQEAQ